MPPVSDPVVNDVVVSGAQPDPNFASNGRIDVKATPLTGDGNGIITTDLDVDVVVNQHVKAHQDDIEASVQAESTSTASGDQPAIPILLDGSGSMGTSDPNEVRVDGANEFVNILDQRGPFESAILEFPGSSRTPDLSETSLYAGFTGEVDSLRRATQKVMASGSTPMYASMAEVLAYSERERSKRDFQKGLVLLADGQPNESGAVTEDSVCVSANQKDAPIFAIGLGPASDLTDDSEPEAVRTMRSLARCTGGGYRGLTADSVEVIEEAFGSAALSSTEGSVSYSVTIESGRSAIDSGDTLILTLIVRSGGSEVQKQFQVNI